MYFTVYKITNLLDGKFYIGKHQTKNLDDGYFGSGKVLKRAIAKHGKKNFKKEILEVHETEEAMNAAEKRLVVISEMSYNLCEGGNGGFGFINRSGLNVNHSFTKEQNSKGGLKGSQSENFRKANKKTQFKLGNPGWTGKHTEETKRKISEARRKRIMFP